jgi:hypothetical protein
MQQILEWVLQQGGMVVILLIGILFFFRFIIPAFQGLQEKHETLLQEQIKEHRQRMDLERGQFVETLRHVVETHKATVAIIAAAHEAALQQVVKSVDMLAARVERRSMRAEQLEHARED